MRRFQFLDLKLVLALCLGSAFLLVDAGYEKKQYIEPPPPTYCNPPLVYECKRPCNNECQDLEVRKSCTQNSNPASCDKDCVCPLRTYKQNGICVPPEKCKVTCTHQNMYFKPCITASGGIPSKPPCNQCICVKGYKKHGKGCIIDCPYPKVPGCENPCNGNCKDLAVPKLCPPPPKNCTIGCVCPINTYNQNGNCVPIEKCKVTCPHQNMHFKPCLKTDAGKHVQTPCGLCVCVKGYKKHGKGCIIDCPYPKVPGCKNPCNRNCEDLAVPKPCPPPPKNCTIGCVCPINTYNQNGYCVPIEKCKVTCPHQNMHFQPCNTPIEGKHVQTPCGLCVCEKGYTEKTTCEKTRTPPGSTNPPRPTHSTKPPPPRPTHSTKPPPPRPTHTTKPQPPGPIPPTRPASSQVPKYNKYKKT